jgi:hypothetical protein
MTFHGQFRPEKQTAADTILTSRDCILCATTAFGRTVLAVWLSIAVLWRDGLGHKSYVGKTRIAPIFCETRSKNKCLEIIRKTC